MWVNYFGFLDSTLKGNFTDEGNDTANAAELIITFSLATENGGLGCFGSIYLSL